MDPSADQYQNTDNSQYQQPATESAAYSYDQNIYQDPNYGYSQSTQLGTDQAYQSEGVGQSDYATQGYEETTAEPSLSDYNSHES